MKEQVHFYQDLYKEKPQTATFETFTENVTLPEITRNQKISCEGLINVQECVHVLRKMKKNK